MAPTTVRTSLAPGRWLPERPVDPRKTKHEELGYKKQPRVRGGRRVCGSPSRSAMERLGCVADHSSPACWLLSRIRLHTSERNLPGTGRRRAVGETEGQPRASTLLGCPTTMLRMVPLPGPERNLTQSSLRCRSGISQDDSALPFARAVRSAISSKSASSIFLKLKHVLPWRRLANAAEMPSARVGSSYSGIRW